MKVQKLTLQEIDFVEVEGEFEKRFINAKTYPIFLTNASVKKGYDLGFLESSIFSDLLKFRGLESLLKSNDEETTAQLLNTLDESKMINVIYLALIGANKNLDMTFEDFLDQYHLDFTETTMLYAGVITDLISSDNSFVRGLQKSTKKEKKNSKRQH